MHDTYFLTGLARYRTAIQKSTLNTRRIWKCIGQCCNRGMLVGTVNPVLHFVTKWYHLWFSIFFEIYARYLFERLSIHFYIRQKFGINCKYRIFFSILSMLISKLILFDFINFMNFYRLYIVYKIKRILISFFF